MKKIIRRCGQCHRFREKDWTCRKAKREFVYTKPSTKCVYGEEKKG